MKNKTKEEKDIAIALEAILLCRNNTIKCKNRSLYLTAVKSTCLCPFPQKWKTSRRNAHLKCAEVAASKNNHIFNKKKLKRKTWETEQSFFCPSFGLKFITNTTNAVCTQ